MDEWVVERLQLIFLRSKASQAFAKEKDSQRVHVGNQHVDSEVELVLVDEVWILNILLHDQMLTRINLIKPLRNKYSLTLRHCFGLHDEIGVWIGIRVVLQILQLMRQQPGFGKEFVIAWELLLHFV